MNFLRRRIELLRGTRHCPTKYLRPVLHAALIAALILVSALAGFMWSHSALPALIEENQMLRGKVAERDAWLNGTARMKNDEDGEAASCVWEKIILIKEK